MILTESDNSCSVTISSGEIVTIRLKENPSTGFLWQIEEDGGLVQTGDFREAASAIGAEGVRILQFRTEKKGVFQLNLKKLRVWEGDKSIIDRFAIKIIVK